MGKQETLGKIAFINHDKNYVMIEYEQAGKKKTVKGSINLSESNELTGKKHNFLIGDVVSFNLKATQKGDRMAATHINFLYNNALDVLVNKARDKNHFTGFIKYADDKFFVKEIESYIFFPLEVSSWQIMPGEDEMENLTDFTLNHLDHKEKITASLLNKNYIPEFKLAVKHFKSNTAVSATVTKISPHGLYINMFGDKISSKIPLAKNENAAAIADKSKVGDSIEVIIKHIGKSRIVVDLATQL